jgi:hypothetical protein
MMPRGIVVPTARRRIEVVFEHPTGRLGEREFAIQWLAAWRRYDAWNAIQPGKIHLHASAAAAASRRENRHESDERLVRVFPPD